VNTAYIHWLQRASGGGSTENCGGGGVMARLAKPGSATTRIPLVQPGQANGPKRFLGAWLKGLARRPNAAHVPYGSLAGD
jgi:hypothetical protein